MMHTNVSQHDLLVEEVNINLDVLGTSMMNWIGCHIDNIDVVAIDDRHI